MKDLTLEHVRKILPDWLEISNAIDAALDGVGSNEDFQAWEQSRMIHDYTLREAFYKDTSDRNSRDNCMLAGISWIIKMAKEKEAS